MIGIYVIMVEVIYLLLQVNCTIIVLHIKVRVLMGYCAGFILLGEAPCLHHTSIPEHCPKNKVTSWLWKANCWLESSQASVLFAESVLGSLQGKVSNCLLEVWIRAGPAGYIMDCFVSQPSMRSSNHVLKREKEK